MRSCRESECLRMVACEIVEYRQYSKQNRFYDMPTTTVRTNTPMLHVLEPFFLDLQIRLGRLTKNESIYINAPQRVIG